MKENKSRLYFSMFLGTFGNILLAIAIMKYLVKDHDTLGYGLTLFGYVLTGTYINELQRKAGISKKFIWIKSSIISLSFIVSALYFFYF